MKLLITGATGFIGLRLCQKLFSEGHELVILSRNVSAAQKLFSYPVSVFTWNPETELVPPEALQGVDGVIHLAGHPVAGGRWTLAVKKKIRDSRILGSQNLMRSIAAITTKPKVVVSASAIGFYGERGDETLTEDSKVGSGFLAEVCQDWENAVLQNAPVGVRIAAIRIGIVLGNGGGALAKMLPIFKMGVGGKLGSGKQWMSWIHVDDLVNLFCEAVKNADYRGVINGVAPSPVTNSEFTKTLASTLKRPAIFPAPAIGMKVVLGEMSTIVLASQKILPNNAVALRFSFQFSLLESALNAICADCDEEFFDCQFFTKPVAEVFAFFSNAENLELLTPPWLHFHIVSTSTLNVEKNTLINYKLKIHGLPVKWQSIIEDYAPPTFFVDSQTNGPYKKWHHTHRFYEVAGGTLVMDHVRYRAPLGILGYAIALLFIKRDLRRIFAYRQNQLAQIFR